MEVKDLIQIKRKENKLTMKELADKVNVSESTVSRWESGEIRDMKVSNVKALSSSLNISILDLMSLDDNYDFKNTIDLKDLDVKPILHITNFVACCGNGIDFEQLEDTEETIYLPTELVGENTKNSWVMHTIGDSMNKRIPENSNIIVKQNDYYNNGDIVLYKITDNFAIKEYYLYADRIVLKPASYNPLHEQETYNFEDRDNGFEFPEIIGKVTGFYGSV